MDTPANDQPITVSMSDLEAAITHDLDKRDEQHRHVETVRERCEGTIYIVCLVIGSVLLMIHLFTDWIPLLVGLPSARAVITQFLR